MKNPDKSAPKDGNNPPSKNTDKIWCPDGGHYQYVKAVRHLARRKIGAKPMLFTENRSLYSSMPSSGIKKTKSHPLLWVVESIQDETSYLDRAWFGCRAVYLHGLMVLVLCSGEEPWNGLLIPTEHQFHDAIQKDLKGMVQHPVLKKWLYLPENQEDFESLAVDLVEAIRLGDQRIGIEPKPRISGKRNS